MYLLYLLVSDVALKIIPGTNDMDGIIFTESFSFRNWTVSPTPPSKKKSILDEFPSSQWLLSMTTAFLSSSICFACGQIRVLHEFNILDSTNPYLSVCFIHHAICQCMHICSMGIHIFWTLQDFIFNILKGQRSMTVFGKGRRSFLPVVLQSYFLKAIF